MFALIQMASRCKPPSPSSGLRLGEPCPDLHLTPTSLPPQLCSSGLRSGHGPTPLPAALSKAGLLAIPLLVSLSLCSFLQVIAARAKTNVSVIMREAVMLFCPLGRGGKDRVCAGAKERNTCLEPWTSSPALEGPKSRPNPNEEARGISDNRAGSDKTNKCLTTAI